MLHRFLRNATATWKTTTVQPVQQDLKGLQVSTELPETLDLQEKWVKTLETFRPCTKTPDVHIARLVRWVPLDSLENWDLEVRGVRMEPPVLQETMEHQDTMESWEIADHLDLLDQLELWEDVEWIQFERKESEDQKEHLGQLELLDWKERGEIEEDWEWMDRWDLLEFKDNLEELDPLESQGRLGLQGQMDRMRCIARVQNELPMEPEVESISLTSNNLIFFKNIYLFFIFIYKKSRQINMQKQPNILMNLGKKKGEIASMSPVGKGGGLVDKSLN